VLLAPGPLESLADSDLEPEAAVQLVAFVTGEAHASVIRPASWGQAAALYLEARLRGRRFRRARRDAREHAGQRLRRLLQLEAQLMRDRAGLPDPERLRQQAAALLAYGQRVVPGSEEALLPDPAAASATIRVALDPRLTAPANADRLFEKARRVTAAARRIEARLEATREALAPAREAEARVLAARRFEELPPPGAEREDTAREKGGPRHYLTSHGLSILVGRGARENHRLTFQVAGPEDHWLHARGVPGSHVILRDNEGRARPRDLEEAAELAAFFSAARAESAVDVHVVRRKHLRPATGGPGRVRVGHSETLRVAPRDPEGRLRRR
jgi:predicted ribosome quality control (RQC) complex YloA/Tae2 family protein